MVFFLGCVGYSIAEAKKVPDTNVTRQQHVINALKQIRNSGLVPSGAWSGWDGSDSGISSGMDYPCQDCETPWVKYDNVKISVPANNSGILPEDPAGVTRPWPDEVNGQDVYKPTSLVLVSLSGKYVDSDLLRIKTVLFHELVHVAQYRDTDGHWDPNPQADGNSIYNEDKEDDLIQIKEIEASARTLKFLQSLLKKKEFPKKRILFEFRREMENLQKNLRKASEAAKKIHGEDWGKKVLGKWLPKDLLALILMKKFVYYGWATSGTMTIEEIAHLMVVGGYLDGLDGVQDDKIYDEELAKMFIQAIIWAREEKELRGHILVNAVMAFSRGEVEEAVNKLQSFVNRIDAQQKKLTNEVTEQALALVYLLWDYMILPIDDPPEPLFIEPLDGQEVSLGSWIWLLVEDANSATDIICVEFEICEDGMVVWMPIGTDNDETGGWGIEWECTVPIIGIYSLKAVMTDLAGQTGEAIVSVVVSFP